MGKFFVVFFLVLNIFFSLHINQGLVFADTVGDPSSPGGGSSSNTFVQDPRVTFSGKFAARASNFLDWTLGNYQWSDSQSGTSSLSTAWNQNRNIVYLSLISFIMITGFILIATRGKSLTASRFLPQLLIIILAVTLSFALVRILYQLTDIISAFFLHNSSGGTLGASDLLKIDSNSNYVNFTGYRLPDPVYDESVFTTLSLVELTAITYYVLAGILLFRKIVLWFFILLSPFYPLLAFFPPMRNTALTWSKHFFRWLLYGPIFAILFSGLILIWTAGIPLPFDFTGLGKFQLVAYPTATNIVLAGPGQAASTNNSLNTVDTYAYYVVALLMLWVTIVLPYFLSKVSFDYIKNAATTNIAANQFVQSLTTRYRDFSNPKKPSTPGKVSDDAPGPKYFTPSEDRI